MDLRLDDILLLVSLTFFNCPQRERQDEVIRER